METSNVKIGNVMVGGYYPPRVVGVISNEPVRQARLGKNEGADILEVRIDLLLDKYVKAAKHSLDEVSKLDKGIKAVNRALNEVIKYSGGIPLIGTIRTPAEPGGKYYGSEKDREGLFEEYLPLLDSIDIEFNSASRKKITRLVHNSEKLNISRKPVIVSYHNPAYTPPNKELSQLVSNAFGEGADLVKIVTLPNHLSDIHRLYSLAMEFSNQPVCIFGLGISGISSRIISLEFGASFTYGYLGTPVAPYSLPVEYIKKEIQRLLVGVLAVRDKT